MKSIVKKIDITISPLCQRAKLLTFYKFWRFCQELKITKSPSERKGELLKEPDFLKREGEGGRNAVPCRLGQIVRIGQAEMNGFIPQRKLAAESGAEIFLIILLKPMACEIINQIRLSAPADRKSTRLNSSHSSIS